MKKSTISLLVFYILTTICGSVLKIIGYATVGDVVFMVSLVSLVVLIGDLFFNLRKKAV